MIRDPSSTQRRRMTWVSSWRKRAIFFPITRRGSRPSSLKDIRTRSLTEELPRNHPDDGYYSQRGSMTILQGTLLLPSHGGGAGIQTGQFTELRRKFSQEDINTFGSLIGDFNPVHFPSTHQSKNDESDRQQHDSVEVIQQQHDTRTPILHGILLSSLFSTIFGTLIPGCIYRSQTLKFHQPVYVRFVGECS